MDIKSDSEMALELLMHKKLREMDIDQLYHHLKDPVVMNKVNDAQRMVLIDIKETGQWGSIYEIE